MKHALAFILLFTVWVSSGQTVVDPHTFTQETNPDNSNFEFYSRATGVNRRATFNNVRKRMTPTAQQTSIAYYPAPTGNTSNLGEVVRDPSGNIWYIDGLGQALRLNAMVAGSGITIAGDTITAADTDPLNEAWTIDADDADQEVISSQVVKFEGAGINVTDYNPGTNTLLITGTEVDGSTTNEIQQIDTLSFSGSTLSVSLSSDGVPAKTVSIPAGTFDRFSFSATAPADTNYIWAKTNNAPWKLDSVFTYEFGSWHIAGFYDRISGVFSEKPPLFVVATGQSNMLGIDGGGDTTTDRRLVAWDTTAHVWKVANLGVNPFNSTGANSLAFSFGKEVARRENRIVRLIVMAKSSQAISAWFGSSTTSIAYNTNLNVLQSGMPRCDVILWHQGESNYDGAGGCNNNTCYTDSLYAIIRQFRGYSWADEKTLFIAGGLFDGAGATQDDRNAALMGLNSDTISTTGFAYATGLDDSGDAVHFSGPSLVTLGSERYYNVYRALPNLYNHNGGGGSTVIPDTEIAYGDGAGITSASTFVYDSGKVGLNNATPIQELDVLGDGLIRGSLRVNAVGDSALFFGKLPPSFALTKGMFEVWNNAGSSRMLYITRSATGHNMFFNSGTASLTGSQNNGFGVNALLNVTSGVDNNAFGYRTLEAMQGGTKNMGMGTLALLAATSGFSNVAIGYGAVAAVTTGFQNIGIGTQAMLSSGTGISANVAIGTQAGQYFAANGNVAIGHLAGQNTSSGDYNVFIGYATGRNTTGTGNVQIGASQTATLSESNALRIENSNGTTPLIGGDFSGNEVGVNLAPSAISAALHVHGNGTSSSTYSGIFEKSDGTDVLVVRDDGLCAIGGAPVTGFSLYTNGATRTDGLGLFRGAGSATGSTTAAGVRLYNTSSTETYNIAAKDGGGAAIYDNGGAEAWTMTAAGLIGMGDTSPEEKLDVDGNVKALHYIGQSTAPGVVKGADNVVGTAASGATVSLSGTDAGFEVTLTTGSAGISTTGDLFTVTFNAAYGAAPVVVYSASNAAAGSYPLTGYTYSTATTTTVVLTNAVTNLTDETDYKWSFVVMGK
jgi:hypothetical protein